MQGRAFAIGMLALVVAAVVAGLVAVGGPGEARRDRFDMRRYDDLAFIANALLCANRRIANPVLPEKLTVENLRNYCSGVRAVAAQLTDSETGRPFFYTRKSNEEFAVCATFHDAKKIATLRPASANTSFAFDPDAGCVTGRIK